MLHDADMLYGAFPPSGSNSFGEISDVARLVCFLAGPDSKYMTGSFVTVDGGAAAMLGTGAPL